MLKMWGKGFMAIELFGQPSKGYIWCKSKTVNAPRKHLHNHEILAVPCYGNISCLQELGNFLELKGELMEIKSTQYRKKTSGSLSVVTVNQGLGEGLPTSWTRGTRLKQQWSGSRKREVNILEWLSQSPDQKFY